MSPDGNPAKRRARERFAFLYAVRGWAILGVMLVHIGQRLSGLIPPLLETWVQNGALAVGIFFMLSMTGLTLSYRSQRLVDNRPLVTLAVRRFVHLAPLFWLMIAINLALYGFAPRYWAPNGVGLGTVLLTMFFLHGWHPTTFNSAVPGGWYLAVDAMMLLSLPVLMWKTYSPKRLLLISGVMALAGSVISLVTYNFFALDLAPNLREQFGAFLYFWFPNQLCVIILGTALFPIIRAALLPSRGPAGNLEVAVIVVFLLTFFGLLSLPPLPFVPIHYIVALNFVVLTATLARKPIYLLVNPWISQFGKLSYSLFLTHFLVLDAIPDWIAAVAPTLRTHPNAYSACLVLSVVTVSYLLALVAHYLVERPSLRLAGLLSLRIQGRMGRSAAKRDLPASETLPETPFEGDSR